MVLQVGVKVLLKNNEGKFLLVRRNPKKYPEVGPKWDLVGGRIEPGSDLVNNLKREIKEEVDLELLADVELVAAQDILKMDKHVVRLTYVGTIEGEPKIDGDHTEARWFEAGEIRALAEEEVDQYFRELIQTNAINL